MQQYDPYSLEEHRYLSRLQNSELRQNQKVSRHLNHFVLPKIEKQRYIEKQEDDENKRRMLNKFIYERS